MSRLTRSFFCCLKSQRLSLVITDDKEKQEENGGSDDIVKKPLDDSRTGLSSDDATCRTKLELEESQVEAKISVSECEAKPLEFETAAANIDSESQAVGTKASEVYTEPSDIELSTEAASTSTSSIVMPPTWEITASAEPDVEAEACGSVTPVDGAAGEYDEQQLTSSLNQTCVHDDKKENPVNGIRDVSVQICDILKSMKHDDLDFIDPEHYTTLESLVERLEAVADELERDMDIIH